MWKFAAIAMLSITLLLAGCSDTELQANDTESSALDNEQERFSIHRTNIEKLYILVDHETGAQYMYFIKAGAICPILDVDGTPLLIDEAEK